MQNTQGYCANCNTERMLTAEDTGFGTIGTVLLICMLGPIGLLIVLMGRGRGNWRCAVCGISIQAGRTNYSPFRLHNSNPPIAPETLSDRTGRSAQIGPQGTYRGLGIIIAALLGFVFIVIPCCSFQYQLFFPARNVRPLSTDNPETTTSPSIAEDDAKPFGRHRGFGSSAKFKDTVYEWVDEGDHLYRATHLGSDDHLTPVCDLPEFAFDRNDYKSLPNAVGIALLTRRVGWMQETQTMAQFHQRLSEVGRQPCRLELVVSDVFPPESLGGTVAKFVIVDDDGFNAMSKIVGSTKSLETCRIQRMSHPPPVPGINIQSWQKGDRVTLVGLFYPILNSGSYGTDRLPEGSRAWIMLGLGKSYSTEYRRNNQPLFLFRNWFIANHVTNH